MMCMEETAVLTDSKIHRMYISHEMTQSELHFHVLGSVNKLDKDAVNIAYNSVFFLII